MFGPKELDIRNVYSPDLRNIQESANRTFGEANSFFRKEELYLEDVEKRLKSGELTSPEDIYDECHAIASDLAKCCEMYLKALYIFENNVPGNEIDALWEKLKNSEFQTDINGNLIYRTPTGIITFVMYDENNNPIVDEHNNYIYFDANGNTYNANTRGAKIKRNGHQLDRLIELLSPESKLYLETRMLSIPMGETEKNNSVSILDFLIQKGVLDSEEHMTREQYVSWIEQHKKTFEESRYSGQRKYDVNVEFLHHLATQIKAVVQFRIHPEREQHFVISDDELAKLPKEIQQLAAFHSHLISEQLLKNVANDERINKKIQILLSNNYVLPNVSSSKFCQMLELMDISEILCVSYLCYLFDNYESININLINSSSKKFYDVTELVDFIRTFNFDSNKFVNYCCQLKQTFNPSIKIDFEGLKSILKLTKHITFSNNKIRFVSPEIHGASFYNRNAASSDYKYLKEDVKQYQNTINDLGSSKHL